MNIFNRLRQRMQATTGLVATSIYGTSVNGGPWEFSRNLVPTEGILDLLEVYIGDGTQTSTWYLAPFAGNVTPASTWTAANFTANSTEFINYTGSTRPALVPGAAASGEINNLASLASITIGADAQDTIWGLALLSSSGKSSTTGKLFSASRLGSARANLVEGDQIQLSYRLQISNA
mgnify:CR=1 FL=1